MAFDKVKESPFVAYIRETLIRKRELSLLLETETNAYKRIHLQGLLNANKQCINLAYGNLSSKDSSIFSIVCASAITGYIRKVLMQVKQHIKQKGVNGIEAEVIANYTDSIMV